MPKTKQKFIEVKIKGYIKSPELSAAGYAEFEGRMKAIQTIASDQMIDVEVSKKEVTRHVEAPEAPSTADE